MLRFEIHADIPQPVGALEARGQIEVPIDPLQEAATDGVDPDDPHDVEGVDERADGDDHAPIRLRRLQVAVVAPA